MTGRICEVGLSFDDVVCSAENVRALDFLEVLAETIETKDPSIHGHSRRVSFYANALAGRAGVSDADRQRVRIGAFLHDLGKVGVPSDLLLREGTLSAAERRIVQQHPVIGERLVKPLGLNASLVHAIRHHHEWWNGRGYPDRLAGDAIPYAARIVSIADAYDAMTTDRPYRRALPRDVVLDELVAGAGVQFDPELAQEFVSLLESHDGAAEIGRLAEAPVRHQTVARAFAAL